MTASRLPNLRARNEYAYNTPVTTLGELEDQIIECTTCPRLIDYCSAVARKKKRAYRNDEYWGRPVPGFGDPQARLLIVGLAPAAHGANRTGRMFTGDGSDGMGSADFLARALHDAGLATHATSRARGDGYTLRGVYLTCIVRCAPPGNKPTRPEIDNCARHLLRELELLPEVRAVLALGKLAFDQIVRLWRVRGADVPRPAPKFGHGATFAVGAGFPVLVGSYHPSRQNTQTGRLTEAMLETVITLAQRFCN